MAELIQDIFVNPPIAIARLGGSSAPQEAYQWIQNPRPRANAETVIAPTWSLRILPDSSVEPYLPTEVNLRDGELIRPVAPFFEIWVRLGQAGSDESTWRDAPLTPSLLEKFNIPLANLVLHVDAQNRKAARRAQSAALRFGTFPPVAVAADNHALVPLLAVSSPGAAQPLIPVGRNIPLGTVQFLRSKPQPNAGQAWLNTINVEVLRFRFTPARGRIYGPPDTSQPHTAPVGDPAPPVLEPYNFLNPNAGWRGSTSDLAQIVSPWDTYDGADVGTGANSNISLGVVDDTCEATIKVSLTTTGNNARVLNANANVFVAPPDFAPDRRPFISLADEINDRSADSNVRNADLTPAQTEQWVEDLFERIYETLSLLNLDFYRSNRAINLPKNQRRTSAIPGDSLPRPLQALGGRDALRNPDFAVGPANDADPLPLSTHARMRHRALSDLQALHDFVQLRPGRLAQLIRKTFHLDAAETAIATNMQMPPLMRNSNALPLTLTSWQYDLLMSWVSEVTNTPVATPLGRSAVVANRARVRHAQVLGRIRGNTDSGGNR